MKNSTIILIIVIGLLLIGGAYYLVQLENTSSGETNLEETPTSEFPNLETSDEVLAEIDTAFEEVE